MVVRTRKKLIEVALPLEAINAASAREKSIRHGHPSTLHLWWARRPLAAARAVIFAQMVDDPSEYVDKLLSLAEVRQAAEEELKSRRLLWEKRKAEHELRPDVSEPGPEPTLEDCAADMERQRLFRLIEELVKWENTTNEEVLSSARKEIRRSCMPEAPPKTRDLQVISEQALRFDVSKNRSGEELAQLAEKTIAVYRRTARWQGPIADLRAVLYFLQRKDKWNDGHLLEEPRFAAEFTSLYDAIRARWPEVGPEVPAFHDPFAGGGALPLEAQRLGLDAYASDLNPVAVLINKAMIEIPPKFAGRPPVNPERDPHVHWKGAQGLADDVRYYGQWMRNEAEKRIGNLYPKIAITAELAKGRPDLKKYIGQKLTVIAWLWARTVKSPNPAFANVHVPLASTFMLSTKAGKEAYVEPVIEGGGYRFTVKTGKPTKAEAVKLGTTAGKRSAFRCLMSGVPVTYDHVRSEGKSGRMGARLMAIVAEGERGRVYIAPTLEHENVARKAKPDWRPEMSLPDNPRDFKTPNYGMTIFGDLFTPRQLVALTTFSDLVGEAIALIRRDAAAVGGVNDDKHLRDGGAGAAAYAEAVGTYLAFSVDKAADYNSTICGWISGGETLRNTFGRQAIPMVWDYCETNTLGGATGSINSGIGQVAMAVEALVSGSDGSAAQGDARSVAVRGRVVSTDPPYYDNIGYADLSDFFYVWLRRSLKSVFPDLFATLAVPKAEELVATPYRHGSREKAENFFLDGMTQAMHRLAEQAHPAFPVTIYYAFKQAESDDEAGTASTGWDTFLAAVIEAGFAISGTWPMRTERGARSIGIGTNALASSIILVCRQRATNAPAATRREFVTTLKAELPRALAHLQRGNIAPVDLAQAAIGPGMGVYSRYAKVLDAEGKPVSVREALALINQTLDEVLTEQEGDFDADSRWAVAWFEQHGFSEGEFGIAETLSKAKNTSVAGLAETGIVDSRRGKVRLLKPEELQVDWDPITDLRLSAWEAVHHLIRVLVAGEAKAAELVAKLGSKAEVARELAYRLYTIAERKKRASEALAYNGLVQSWPEIARLAQEGPGRGPAEPGLFEKTEA